MGVLGLWDLLNSVGHPIKLDGIEGKVLGVDANIWLYKFIRGFREKDNASYSIDSHKLGLYNRICKLLFYRIKPVFVFDGPAPVLKRRTLERRQNFRNKNLSKVQDAAMRALACQLKSQYPNADIDNLKIHLPELKSNYLVAAEKMTEEDDDLFYLPPHIRNENPDKQVTSSEDEFSSSDSGDVNLVHDYAHSARKQKVDIHSEDFKQLPAEIRYELLHDIKESSKRITKDESLPEDAGSFSSFQLQRLKVRRQIQEKIEECQKDICSNFAGELGDGHTIKAFRMQSDATSTLLYKKNPKENDEKLKKEDLLTSQDSSKSVHQHDCDEDSVQKSIRVFRPNMKLLFDEKKPDGNFIRLPGALTSSTGNNQAEVDGPALSPEHGTSESSNESTGVRSIGPEPSAQLSDASTILDEEVSDSSSESSSEEADDLEPVSEETSPIASPTKLNESLEDMASFEQNKNVTINLVTPEGKKNNLKDSEDEHSVVDLTDSIAEGSVDEERQDSEFPLPPPKKVNITIEISDDEDYQEDKNEERTPLEHLESPKMSSVPEREKVPLNPDEANESMSRSQPILSESRSHVDELPASSKDIQATLSSSQPIKTTGLKQPKAATSSTIQESTITLEQAANAQRAANRVTTKIIDDAKELLRLFGIPYIDAAGEAEAQCALLEELKLTEGTITDDSDIWLFGAQCVYRHFFSDDKYVMQYKMTDIVYQMGMTREYLVCFAMLVGSDYTDGIMNVGPVTATEILSEFEGEGMEPLLKFKDWHQKTQLDKTLVGNKKRKNLLKFKLPDEFPSRAVYEGYLKPVADSSTEQFTWGSPDLDELREYAQRNFAWDQKKIDEKLVPVMKKLNEKKLQRTIDTFFFKTQANRNPELFRSKRVNQALNKIAKRTAREVKEAAPPAAADEPVNLSEEDE